MLIFTTDDNSIMVKFTKNQVRAFQSFRKGTMGALGAFNKISHLVHHGSPSLHSFGDALQAGASMATAVGDARTALTALSML